MSEYGFVYCLSNECMPGVFKIGFTRGSPHFRAQQLSAPTGVPIPFEVDWYVEAERADLLERDLHEQLRNYRICSSREFFKVCPVKAFTALDGRYVSDWLSPDHLFLLEQRKKALALVG